MRMRAVAGCDHFPVRVQGQSSGRTSDHQSLAGTRSRNHGDASEFASGVYRHPRRRITGLSLPFVVLGLLPQSYARRRRHFEKERCTPFLWGDSNHVTGH